MLTFPSHDTYYPTTPFYVDKDRIMFIQKQGDYGSINPYRGTLVIFSAETRLECYQYYGDMQPLGGNIIVANSKGVLLISSQDCSIIQTVLTEEQISKIGDKVNVNSRGLSKDLSYIIVDNNYQLLKVDLSTLSVFDYKKFGTYPVISNDGNMFVYLSTDGIHISQISGENDRLIVPYVSSVDGDFFSFSRGVAPYPNWSSDSKKIIYHKCILPNYEPCKSIDEYGICIFNIDSNTEEQVIIGGLFPAFNVFE